MAAASVEDLRKQLAKQQQLTEYQAGALQSQEAHTRSILAVFDVLEQSKEKSVAAWNTDLIEVLENILDAERVAIYFSGSSSYFGLEALETADSDAWKSRKIPKSKIHRVARETAVQMACRQNTPLLIPDGSKDSRYSAVDAEFDRQNKLETKSMVVGVVRDTNGSTLAVIQACNKQPNRAALRARNKIPGTPTQTPLFRIYDGEEDEEEEGGGERTSQKMASPRVGRENSANIFLKRGIHFSQELQALAEEAEEEREMAAMMRKALNDYESKHSGKLCFSKMDAVLLETVCEVLRSQMRRRRHDAISDNLRNSSNNGGVNAKKKVTSLLGIYDRSWKNQSRMDAVRSRTMSYQVPSITRDFEPQLLNLQFDVWQHNDNDLLAYTISIFRELGFFTAFPLNPITLSNFVTSVRKRYRKNPFHNWQHAFSTLQFAFLALRRADAGDFLLPIDVLGLMLAALCHDLDHPGNTNAFEINTQTNRALVYNDVSVLENHHAFTLFTLLKEENCNVLEKFPPDDQRRLRQLIVRAILSTDMTAHFDKLKALDGVDVSRNHSVFDVSSERDRTFVVELLTHTADLSGQVYPWNIAKVWEERISNEFRQQAKAEAKLGLPIAPFMQGLADEKVRAKLQVNFIDFVLDPWWRSMTRVFPKLSVCYRTLQRNRKKYGERACLLSTDEDDVEAFLADEEDFEEAEDKE